MPASKTIKELRISIGLDQTEFARLIGISKSTICNYEKGKRTPRFPIIKKMRDLAKKNGIELLVNDFLD